jgi:hypothetical protein
MDEDFFKTWCSAKIHTHGTYRREVLGEVYSARREVASTLNEVVQTHYVDPERVKERIERLGYKKAAKRLNSYLPTTSRARSGDLGEILATEYVNRRMSFRVPLFRLRWKDGRNMALRGDDVIAIGNEGGNLQLLKGEVKSRRKLVATTVRYALRQLRKNASRPSGHTVNYLIDRLIELGRPKTAARLEDYLDIGISAQNLHHLLFTLSANDPTELFDAELVDYSRKVDFAAVGLVVKDHADFIKQIYEGLKWQPETRSKAS